VKPTSAARFTRCRHRRGPRHAVPAVP